MVIKKGRGMVWRPRKVYSKHINSNYILGYINFFKNDMCHLYMLRFYYAIFKHTSPLCGREKKPHTMG